MLYFFRNAKHKGNEGPAQLEEFSSWTMQKTENYIKRGMMIDVDDLKVH